MHRSVFNIIHTKVCCLNGSPTGAGFFDADEDNIKVKDDGRIHFNLSLTFSMSGASGLVQEIVRFVLIKDNAVIVQCPVDINETPCTFSGADDSQWWTVEIEEGGRHVLFVLHQAMSSDRGSYTAIYEGSDPATDSLNTGRKTIHVTGEWLAYVLFFCST